ncbi:MAG TPA: cob(I)yrinic acid a,c-diamide adenosyltransferase [Candidatus Aminicenantes bacterium]|nr:cob(I)yrinic acid a,c-diamide adenosyltransferase [Candidatus Aminicenantes bacterium]
MIVPALIQVYTGNGKGKTTAALGLALRAAGRGHHTYMAQFLKQGDYGEHLIVRRALGEWLRIEQFGLPGFHHQEHGVAPAEVAAAEAGLAAVEREFAQRWADLVILDEVNTLLHFGIVPENRVLALLDRRPEGVELVLTGRYAPAAIIARADLVTEMTEVRHPYQRGIPARDGIER